MTAAWDDDDACIYQHVLRDQLVSAEWQRLVHQLEQTSYTCAWCNELVRDESKNIGAWQCSGNHRSSRPDVAHSVWPCCGKLTHVWSQDEIDGRVVVPVKDGCVRGDHRARRLPWMAGNDAMPLPILVADLHIRPAEKQSIMVRTDDYVVVARYDWRNEPTLPNDTVGRPEPLYRV